MNKQEFGITNNFKFVNKKSKNKYLQALEKEIKELTMILKDKQTEYYFCLDD